jgi:prevent-host-death family protein
MRFAHMVTVSIRMLKNKMPEYFRHVEITGEELIVTDHRRAVVRIIPYRESKSLKELFENYQGKAMYLAPVTETETDEWGNLA